MSFTSFAKASLLAASVCAATLAAVPAQAQQNTLKVVMHSDLKIVDPIWTTAYITRNHGYMIYDTLFAMDANGEIKPQMIDKYSVSADNLLWTFTLRDGLLFHDDKPVTSEDAVASIKRWAQKDSLGQKMNSFVKEWKVVDAKTFTATTELAHRPDAAGAGQAVVERALHHAQAHCRDQPERADQGIHRLGPLRLPRRRVEAGRPGGVHQVRQVQATCRAAVGHGRWQGGQGRPHRMARHSRPADRRQRADRRRGGHGRGRQERPAADAGQGREHQDVRPEPAGQPVRAALQHHPQALRQPEGAPGDVLCAEPGGLPEGSARRPEVLQAVQGAVHLRLAAGDGRRHGGQARIQLQEVA